MVQCLDKGEVLHEGQAGFRINRSCIIYRYLYEVVQGKVNRYNYAFFLDVQKAYIRYCMERWVMGENVA